MSYKDNAFPLTQVGANLTAGTYSDIDNETIFLCVLDGDLEVTWADNTTDTVSCIAGNPFILENAKQVTIVSGMFHRK